MSAPIALRSAADRRLGRSFLAVAAALVANAVLALALDQVFHLLEVYPPWGQPMHGTGDNALALGYRLVLGVAAGWLVARLAPRAPMRHAVVLGIVATVLASAGAAVALGEFDLGPAWYPIALALLAYPTVWLGATLHERRPTRV